MSQTASPAFQPPDIDDTGLRERKLWEAEFFALDRQLLNFGRIRDQLSARGIDSAAHYRKLMVRREEIAAAMKAGVAGRMPPLGLSGSSYGRREERLLTRPIKPGWFDPGFGGFGLGTSGIVQMGTAVDGVNEVGHGRFPTSGEILPVPGAYPGSVWYGGGLTVDPEYSEDFDPTINYFWVRTWKYLIPFPPATADSRFTYEFGVPALVSLNHLRGEGLVVVYASVGETSNLTTGTTVVVNEDVGWPVQADVSLPADGYNGHYGRLSGHINVRRSFMVGRLAVPGVAVVVGVVAGLSMSSQLALTFADYSSISVGAQNRTGRVLYTYDPVVIVQQ